MHALTPYKTKSVFQFNNETSIYVSTTSNLDYFARTLKCKGVQSVAQLTKRDT